MPRRKATAFAPPAITRRVGEKTITTNNRTGVVGMGAVLTNLLKTHAEKRGTADPALMAAWPNIVGSHLAPHCHPQGIRGTTLIITTQNPTAKQQLVYTQRDILKNVQGFYGIATVAKVQIK